MKRVINFVKGRRDDRRDKYVNSPICVEITNPAGQKIQSEDEHILGLQSGYGYQIDINGKDKNMSKLHKAAWQGNLDKVKVHLKKADVNSVDHSNRTALHFAVAQGHSNVAFFLLGAKALPDLRDSDGMTPFLKAVECGNKECVCMLFEQGADVNIVDRNGNTALHLSSKLGFLNISSLLLMKGANINVSNNTGEFPLHLATEGEHRELVALLLCSGAQINVIDRDNRTPLMLAARFGLTSLVSLFLEHGASLEACDSNGWTAEDYALIGGHQQLALDLKAPAKEQLSKEMEEAVINGSSSDESKEDKTACDWGKDVLSDDSEANQPTIFVKIADVQINAHPVECCNGNDEFNDRTTIREEEVEEKEEECEEIGNEEREDRREEGETVESPRSCITPPPLQPPRSWDLIQAGMIDEKEVQRRSLTTLGTLRSRRESFNENSNNNNTNNNGGSSPNQANDDLDKITDIVRTVQMEGLVDDESSEGEENLPMDRAVSVRRGVKAAPLERTPSLDLTLTEEDLSKSKGSQGCLASSDGGTLGREDTLQGYEEIWERNANVSDANAIDNVDSENNNKLQQSSFVNGDANEVFDTGQFTTDISEQLIQRNREINTAVGYVTNEIYRIMIEKNDNTQSSGTDKVVNQTVHTSSSLDNLDERKSRFIEMESSRSCDNLDKRFMTLEEKLCSGIYSAETLDTESSANAEENGATQSLDNLDESPVGTVIKRNMHREVQSLDTLDDYDQCCNRGCVEARPMKKHARNKSVSVGQHGWSKSVDVLSKPSNIDRIQIDTKKIDAQLECYDEALRELAQVELMKRNSLTRSSGESSSFSLDRRATSKSTNEILDTIQPCLALSRDIPYLSEVVSSSSQKSREYFMKPKDESDFSVNQDFSPLPKILDKAGSVDGLLDVDKASISVESTSINESLKSDSQINNVDNDDSFNYELPPPPPMLPPSATNEIFELKRPMDDERILSGKIVNGACSKQNIEDLIENDDSESKRAREVENNLYKLEKDLFNINMSAIMKPRPSELNHNGVVHQDIVVANGEMPPFDLRSKYLEKGAKRTSFAVFDERALQEGDSSSPVERSAGEESPKLHQKNKKSLKKGKSESEVCKLVDGKEGKSRSKSASVYTDVESLFERPSKGRKKSGGSGERSESDSELCERPLRRKRRMLLAMRGVVAGSKDSEDEDDNSTGDPPFWLSTEKGGHFARQDTVLAVPPVRPTTKTQDPPGFVKGNQSDEKPPDLDKDWTSSDADTASGSDEVIVGSAYSLGSHHKLLKEHLRQATNEKTILEESVAVLREQEERLHYELADSRQALAAREDTITILQDQARRMEARYLNVLDENQTLRHVVSSSEVELKHLRELCDKLAMEKADLSDELNQLRAEAPAGPLSGGLNAQSEPSISITHTRKNKNQTETKVEHVQILQRQKVEAEKKNEILVNHLEEAMRQCEIARTEKEALADQNITDIKKLQRDTLLWKERYEDCLGRLEKIETECHPRLCEAQRTIEVLRNSVKQLEAEKESNQDNWKSRAMDEMNSKSERKRTNDVLPDCGLEQKATAFEISIKQPTDSRKNCCNMKICLNPQTSLKCCEQTGNLNSQNDGISSKCCSTQNVSNCNDNAQKKQISNGQNQDLSLLLQHNKNLLQSLVDAQKEKKSMKNMIREIKRNIECDSQKSESTDDRTTNESSSRVSSVQDISELGQCELKEADHNLQILSELETILTREEAEVEDVLYSIQEIRSDIESITNSLQSQIVLVKNFNQNSSKHSVHRIPSCFLNSSPPSSPPPPPRLPKRCIKFVEKGSNETTNSKVLLQEIETIRKDLSSMRDESECVNKLLNSAIETKFEKSTNVIDELKNTVNCVRGCNEEIARLNTEIVQLQKVVKGLALQTNRQCQCPVDHPINHLKEVLKFNSEILKVHKIIQSLIIQSAKNVCRCPIDHPKPCSKMKPDVSSKWDSDCSKICKAYEQNSLATVTSNNSNKNELPSSQTKYNDMNDSRYLKKCGSRVCNSTQNSVRLVEDNLDNDELESSKAETITLDCCPIKPRNENEMCDESCDQRILLQVKVSCEREINTNVCLDSNGSDIDSSEHSSLKVVFLPPGASSNEVFFLKKALTISSSEYSSEMESQSQLHRLSDVADNGNTSSTCYKSVRTSESLNRSSGTRTVVEPLVGYESDPIFRSIDDCNYYCECCANITISESVPNRTLKSSIQVCQTWCDEKCSSTMEEDVPVEIVEVSVVDDEEEEQQQQPEDTLTASEPEETNSEPPLIIEQESTLGAPSQEIEAEPEVSSPKVDSDLDVAPQVDENLCTGRLMIGEEVSFPGNIESSQKEVEKPTTPVHENVTGAPVTKDFPQIVPSRCQGPPLPPRRKNCTCVGSCRCNCEQPSRICEQPPRICVQPPRIVEKHQPEKSKPSCFGNIFSRKSKASGSKRTDRTINLLLEDVANPSPSIRYNFEFSGKSSFNKHLPIEQSLGYFFKNFSSEDHSLGSRLKFDRFFSDRGEAMKKDLLELSLTDISFLSDGFFPFDSSTEDSLLNQLNDLQFKTEFRKPISVSKPVSRFNVSSLGCRAGLTMDAMTDPDKKPFLAQSNVDPILQAASGSLLLNQDQDAISLHFQQVENLECPDRYEAANICIVNDVSKASNGFQECDQQSVPKNCLSRERQEMAVGRIRQQALLESENNLSAKIAEINSVLHQQLEEQHRRREHNEMQMKKEFELTRQKLLMELSKVQTALKAKEAEERALRDKYEKLSRDVEKTAELKRKQLIEKSYSLNLAHPSTMWEKELSIKRSVVQSPVPPLASPPPPPPPPLPQLPRSLPSDERFSHSSLRAQLHQSIAKHRNNPRNSSDQLNLTPNSNSQSDDQANGSNSGSNLGASSSSNIKR